MATHLERLEPLVKLNLIHQAAAALRLLLQHVEARLRLLHALPLRGHGCGPLPQLPLALELDRLGARVALPRHRRAVILQEGVRQGGLWPPCKQQPDKDGSLGRCKGCGSRCSGGGGTGGGGVLHTRQPSVKIAMVSMHRCARCLAALARPAWGQSLCPPALAQAGA